MAHQTKPQLHYFPGNANLAPHIVLAEAGADFELVLVDRRRDMQNSAEYLRLNPNGRIPTWVSGELILFEAAAICLHVADQYPEARLAPPLGSAARSHLYKWLMFLSNTVQPAYMAFRYPEQMLPSPASGNVADDDEALRRVRAAAAERAARAFEVIEGAFGSGPFLLDEGYSVCDAYLFMLAWWARALPRSPGRLPRLRGCVEAVARRPATERACRAEGVEVSFDS